MDLVFAYIQITNNTTGVDDSAGALIQQDGNDLYIWNKENSFMSLGTNATESARLYANSKLHLGNSHRSNSNLSRLHVGWNTGGTVAGESIIAGTVGNDTTAVSALLTLKNAGNRMLRVLVVVHHWQNLSLIMEQHLKLISMVVEHYNINQHVR